MSLIQLEGDISLKEKYLSFNKEKRIRRMQFFERMLIPGILLWLILGIPSIIAGIIVAPENILKTSFYISIIIYTLYIFIIFKFYPYVIQKRAHDFGKDGKIETNILLYGTIISIIFSLYLQYLMLNIDIMKVMNLSQYNNIINGILSIVWLYLLFRPGTKGNNTHGEQKYYKLKFLG